MSPIWFLFCFGKWYLSVLQRNVFQRQVTKFALENMTTYCSRKIWPYAKTAIL